MGKVLQSPLNRYTFEAMAIGLGHYDPLSSHEIDGVRKEKERLTAVKKKRNVHGRLNASWKICFLAVNGQSFLVIDGYLLNPQGGKKKKKKKKKKVLSLIPLL